MTDQQSVQAGGDATRELPRPGGTSRAADQGHRWVRKVGNENVEAIAAGEREKVERFIEMMKQGPNMSRVDESTVEGENLTGEFGVRRSG